MGTLSAVTGATAGNCPAGRVLRENGRKLYPSANPGITTYMVGVYDAQTMLSGFIDPNAGVFQIYNTDKPTYLLDGVEPTLGTTDQGPSVYTRGTVTAIGDITTSGGNIAATLGAITAGKQIRSTTVTALGTGSTFVIDASLGQVFTLTTNANATVTATNLAAGQVVYIIVTGDAGGRTIDFNTQFRTLNAGVRTINASLCTFSFVSDGTALYQIGEAIGLSA